MFSVLLVKHMNNMIANFQVFISRIDYLLDENSYIKKKKNQDIFNNLKVMNCFWNFY